MVWALSLPGNSLTCQATSLRCSVEEMVSAVLFMNEKLPWYRTEDMFVAHNLHCIGTYWAFEVQLNTARGRVSVFLPKAQLA